MVQRAALPSGGILYDKTSTGPPMPVRARTKTRPPDSSKIIPSINANANLGILIVVLPFCHQFRRTLCSFSQEPAFSSPRSSRLANRRSSAPTAECLFGCGSGTAAVSEPGRTRRTESGFLGEGTESSSELVAKREDNDENSEVCICIDAGDDLAAIWRSRFGAGTHGHGRTSARVTVQNSARRQSSTLHHYDGRKSQNQSLQLQHRGAVGCSYGEHPFREQGRRADRVGGKNQVRNPSAKPRSEQYR